MHLRSVTLYPDKYPTRNHYPFNLDIFHQSRHVMLDSPATFFVGENGTGKSTLLEAIANRCGIHIWRNAERTRFEFNAYEKKFRDYISLEWFDGPVPGAFFGASVFHDFVQSLDEWAAADPGQLEYFGGRSLVTQSHGQSIMSFFNARYQIKGLYLLDEPETALSPKTQIKLLELLNRVSKAGHAQFIIATHSPILLSCPEAVIYSFDNSPIKPVEYEETDHYKVYKNFLGDRNKYLNEL